MENVRRRIGGEERLRSEKLNILDLSTGCNACVGMPFKELKGTGNKTNMLVTSFCALLRQKWPWVRPKRKELL